MKGKSVGSLLGLALAASVAGGAANAQNSAIPSISTTPGSSPFTRNSSIPRINGAPNGRLAPMTGGTSGATAVTLPTPNAYSEIVLTDPLVLQTQIGSPPVGLLADGDLTQGTGVANVPGVGLRAIRTVGPVIQTAAGPAVRAVDASTGVEFLVLTPATPEPTDPGPLVPAKVVRVTSDGVILERDANGKKVTEILPSARVYSAIRGGFVPAASVRRLRVGADVLIPTSGGPRGTITVTRASSFKTKSSSASSKTKRGTE